MYRKEFENNLYQTYDPMAKKALSRLLRKRGHEVLDTKENFGADIKAKINGKEHYCEVEVKRGWEGKWPMHWTDVRIPERKQRLLKQHSEDLSRLSFFVFAMDMQRVWRIPAKYLTRDLLKHVYSPNIAEEELFFCVPLIYARLYEV
jgi:hypothetical protein